MTPRLQPVPVKSSDMESKLWYRANFNPYGNPYDGDCMIRAVSAALMMKYKSVCGYLRTGVKVGFGARTEGIAPSALQAFAGYLEPVSVSGMTVGKFIERCGRTGGTPYGIYVVCTESHAVYVCGISSSRKYFIDTWDSSEENVVCAFRVLRQVDQASSDRLTLSEFRRIQAMYSDPEVQEKFREMAAES